MSFSKERDNKQITSIISLYVFLYVYTAKIPSKDYVRLTVKSQILLQPDCSMSEQNLPLCLCSSVILSLSPAIAAKCALVVFSFYSAVNLP